MHARWRPARGLASPLEQDISADRLGGVAAVDQQLGLNAEVAKIASAAFERVDARVVGLLDERVGPPIVVLERLDGPLVVLFGLLHRGGRADTGRAAGVQLGVPV